MAEELRKDIPIEDENAETEDLNTEEQETPKQEGTEEAEIPEEADKEAPKEEVKEDDSKAAAKQESERYLRLLADFQNFRIRTEKEKSDIRAFAIEKVVGDLLPVLDNFERALQMKTDDAESYAKGMELIFSQMMTAFEKAGVKEIPAEGEMFDPNKHNAVMTETSDELEDGMIGKVLQKGYTLNGRVIRPSMVSVVKK